MQFRHKTNFASSIISAPKTITDYALDSIHCKDKRKNKSIWEGVCALLQLINSRHSEDFISKDRLHISEFMYDAANNQTGWCRRKRSHFVHFETIVYITKQNVYKNSRIYSLNPFT